MSDPHVIDSPAAPPVVACSALLYRIRNHISIMAPHQKERYAGRLLIEAEQHIATLERRVAEYQPYADAALAPMLYNAALTDPAAKPKETL